MKPTPFLAAAALCLATLYIGAEVRLSPRFHTVFILRMANGLDQYLASRLTSERVLWVVLEPTSADAVLTNSIDEGFWAWLVRTYPSPAGSASQSSGKNESSAPWVTQPGKHRGTIFLVDPRNRTVVWSTYDHGRDDSPDELDRSAARVASQLKASFNQK